MDVEQRQQHNYKSAPACRLPDELLAEIFAVGYYPKPRRDLHYDYTFAAGDRHILNVSQVCSRWRIAALSTASLWASLYICVQSSRSIMPSYVESMALRFARSRQAPIHMHLDLRFSPEPDFESFGSDECLGTIRQLFSLITANLERCYSLTVDATDISPIFPLKVTPLLKSLKVRVLSGDLDKLVLFRGGVGPTENANLELEELTVKLPMLSRTCIVLQESSTAESSEPTFPQPAAAPPTTKLRVLRFVKTGDENGPLEIISSASRTLEELDWRESVPCIPSLSTTRTLYLPSLRSLSLEGYAPLPPFTPPSHPTGGAPSEHDIPSLHSAILPRLNTLQLLPKGFQRCRRYMFLLPASESSVTTPTTLTATLVSSSPASDLETFLRRSRLPSLRHFELAGAASSIIPSPHSPASASVAHNANNLIESALEVFLASHTPMLETAHVPFVAMPSLTDSLSPSVSLRPPSGMTHAASVGGGPEQSSSSTLVLRFSFRDSCMPDEQRSVAFLRSLLDAADASSSPDGFRYGNGDFKRLELVLARNSGTWEHAYQDLEKEYACDAARVSLCVSPNSSWWNPAP